jgi:hypothetical protein
MPDRLHLSLPVTQARVPQENDKYYPLLEKITEERLWYTSDIVKMIQGATYRDRSGAADVAAILEALGVSL